MKGRQLDWAAVFSIGENQSMLKGTVTSLTNYERHNTTKLVLDGKHLSYVNSTNLPELLLGRLVHLEGSWKESQKVGKYFLVSSFSSHDMVETAIAEKPLAVRLLGKKHVLSETEEDNIKILGVILEHLFNAGQKTLAKKLASLPRPEVIAIKTNPHLLYLENSVTFEVAEIIAREAGSSDSIGRLNAAVSEILDQSYNSGKTSISLPTLVARIKELINTESDPAELKTVISKKVAIIDEASQVFIPKIFYLRQRTLDLVAKNRPSMNSHDDDQLDGLLGRMYTILTGAAGTGKTTHLRNVKAFLEGQGYTVALTALTGKAASILGDGAMTLHKLLGYGHGGFKVKSIKQDVVIVDEASMMDWYTAHTLYKTIGEGRVILSGDPNQLPPVKGGSVFEELIPLLPNVKLEKVHRFVGGESNIQVIQRKSIYDLLSATTTLALTMARKGENFQVLTPVLGSCIGTFNLNRILQGKLNPNGGQITAKYRMGDRVILTKNCYDKEAPAFNGQVGYIVDAEEAGPLYVKLDSGEVLPFTEAELELAYSLTVHKAQGSQFDKVIFVAPKSECGVFLDEKMMYTGNTRGKIKTYCIIC